MSQNPKSAVPDLKPHAPRIETIIVAAADAMTDATTADKKNPPCSRR
ncbi:MAG: hypothetical protein LBE91_00355 [Tannerella sp.]|nr:hypothetical protein [Tannerella sp.]